MDLLVPSTYAADERDMRIRTVKYGQLARVAAIYGYDRVIIYKDNDPKIDQQRSAELIQKHLETAECPPYLRKQLIPKDEDLQYASLLPPLQMRSHGYEKELREAVITEAEGGELQLEAGLESTVTAYGDHQEGERVTARIIDQDTAEIIERGEIDGFWTFDVEERNQKLGEAIRDIEAPVIGTSAHGDPVHDHADAVRDLDDFGVAFGSAWRGIPDMAERGDLELEQLTMMVDCITDQHAETVRTEEALFICSAVLDCIRG